LETTTKRPQATATWLGLALLGAAASAALSCAGGDSPTAAKEREWDALVQTQRALDAERRELTDLRERLAAAAVEADGAPTEGWARKLALDLAARERRVGSRSAALEQRLVRYVEAFAAPPGSTPSPAMQAALHLKSDEDIAVAQEWIERGGDYRRAIEILETQLQVDPGYARLEQALDRARAMRYVTAERFARVHPGMTRVEVRAALGPVNLRQVLRRPAERLEAWFYPKAGGGRAGVYFRFDAERRTFVVYASELATGGRRPPAAAS
jgi:hypothetical protein